MFSESQFYYWVIQIRAHLPRILTLPLHERLLRQTRTRFSQNEADRLVIDSELNLAHWMSFPTSCVPRLLSPSRHRHRCTASLIKQVVVSVFMWWGANLQEVDTITGTLVQYGAIQYNTTTNYLLKISVKPTPFWQIVNNNWRFTELQYIVQLFMLLHSTHRKYYSNVCVSPSAQRKEKPLATIYLRFIEKVNTEQRTAVNVGM